MGTRQNSPRALYRYWNQVRAGRVAPERLEIEPSGIAGILSETFMLERVDAQAYRFRLAGTRLCELFGKELRGTSFLEGWSEADHRPLLHLLAMISEQAAGAALTIEGASNGGSLAVFDAMLLPLVHRGNQINRIIGAMSATTAPHWLGSQPLHSLRLKRHQVVWPAGQPHGLIARADGRASATAPALATTSDRRQFRVVEGGRSAGKAHNR